MNVHPSFPPTRPLRNRHPRWGLRAVLLVLLCALLLWTDIFAGWTATPAHAATVSNPNPTLKTPAWLNGATTPGTHLDLGQYVPAPKASAQQASVQSSASHAWIVPMKPATIALTAAATHFVSSDQQLSVDIPAGSLDPQQSALVQRARTTGGGISLSISQVKPASGGLHSDHIFFGTYAFQFFDRQGHPLSGVRLRSPLAIQFHPSAAQQIQIWQGQKVYAFWSQVNGTPTPAALTTTAKVGKQVVQTAVEPSAATTRPPVLTYAQSDAHGQAWSIQSTLAQPATATKTSGSRAQSIAAVQASTVTFGTQAPQATWGTPSDFQVGLNSGGLTYSSPLSIPPGPGGLQPALAFNYASGSVNENHNVQATASWVGQGWSLDLGSISWAQENVTPNPNDSNPNHIESVWRINDPSGIGGQLIPPDLSYRTADTLNPTLSQLNSSATYIWHTAPESHAKVQEIAFGSYPCWQVWLPSGIMEEFGCTNDSRQAYVDSAGNWVMDKWQLDLMTDRYGDQVHVSYQKHTVNNAVLDSAITDITYDDPGCHNTTTACSTWHPQVDIHFDAGQRVTRLLSGNCGSWTPPNANVRCDDPNDDSASGGLPAPKVMGAYVLNDVQVKVNGNILRQYNLSYNQGGPSGYTDPTTGQAESIAGFLTLAKIETKGTGGTTLNAPTITMQYGGYAEHYSDLFSNATPTTNCSPYGGAPHNGSACYLWAQTYHQYYLNHLDNGQGWNESIVWKEAHANTWGVDSSSVAVNDAFACTNEGQTSTNNCGRADDKNWSWLAVASRTATTNGVSSTWHYYDYLQTNMLGASIPGYSALSCTSVCRQTYTWGNQNDDDYADYYNGDFQSFQRVQVIQPDGSSQVHTYGATTGWGLANGNITCYVPFPAGQTCSVASYTVSTIQGLATVFAGKEQHEEDYDGLSTLMKQVKWSWGANCSPLGVAGSVGAVGGTYDPGTQYLFSELDEGSNPVIVCDPRVAYQDTYLTDGVTGNINDARVVHSTVATTYDGDNQGVAAYDYGNVDTVDTTGNDVGGQHFVQKTTYYPNDNVAGNVYLTDLPAFLRTQDGSGTYYGCQADVYGSNSSAPHPAVIPAVTQQLGYVAQQGGCVPPLVTTQYIYDNSGNPIASTDPDGHQGCSRNSVLNSTCAAYDGFATHLVKVVNAKNQVVTSAYDSNASGGYGQWLTSTTDANGQTTTYTYDVLGRLTSEIAPGDTVSQPTVSYTYTNTCAVGTTSPCLELDTTTRVTSGSATTTTARAWYDGMGRLVETQAPGPNQFSKVPAVGSLLVTYTIYDNMGRVKIASLPYAIATSATTGYANPDLTQARTVTSYDSQGRSLGSVSYGTGTQIFSESTITYTVAQGIPSFNVDTSTPFERTTTLDAYNHQSVSYTDALGRDRYEQVFTGTGSPYGVVRTVQYNRDEVGNVTSTVTFDASSAVRATRHSVYDGLKRVTGFNDSDSGACTNTPMPTSCSSSSDTASKASYDADGNVLSETDPRNVTTYASYDLLDRPLCRGTASSQVNPCGSGAYAAFFYDSYTNTSNSGVTFPSGCTAPSGTSAPVGKAIAETFSGGAGSGWRCNGYDARGQTIAGALSVTVDGQMTTQNVSMSYNDTGEPTTLTYPDGEIVASTYDSKGFFRGMSTSNGAIVSAVQYTNTGQAAGMTLGGIAYQGTVTAPVTVSLGYDSLQRVTSDTVAVGTTTLFSQTQTYDNVGNVLQLATTLPTTSGGSLTDNQSYCYDALNRLVWAGNSGTPTGGDHCGSTPGGSTTPGYSQSFGYDVLDRMLAGTAGTVSYADASHVHAATSMSNIPNPYASYDAMGNMTCRNVDTTGGQSCASGTQTGATMSYDNEGRLTTWTAPSGTTGSDQFLYDAGGNRVLQRSSTTPTGSSIPTITDTITYDGYTDTTISNGTTTTTKYYQAGGQTVAEATGTTWSYLVPDLLKNTTVALRSDGTVQAVQLYAPYGSVRYTDGTIPTPSNFTGQRLDAQTGLLYYNSRYYDAVSGRFTSTDTVQTNAQGADTYAYVNDNPVGRTDPTGHCPWCIIGAVAGALIGAGIDYGMQVYNNYQSGDANPWTDVNWLDVGGAALVGGLIGFGLGPLIPAVGAMIGGTVSTGSIGAGLAAGGGAFAAASGWLDGAVSTPEATPEEQSYAQSRVYTSPGEDPANPSAQTARNAAKIPDPTRAVGQQKTPGAYSILEDQNGNVVGGGQSGPGTINTTYGNPDRPVTPYGINCAEPDCFVNADNAGTLQSNTRYNLYTYKGPKGDGTPCNNCDVSIQRFADKWQSIVRAWFNVPDGSVDYRDYNPQP